MKKLAAKAAPAVAARHAMSAGWRRQSSRPASTSDSPAQKECS